MNIDDKKLNKTFIDLKSKNNSHSFEELYKLANKIVYGVAFSILKNKEDSEDVVQSVFTKILALDKEKLPTTKCASWLYEVTKNEAILIYRKKKDTVEIEQIYEIEDKDNEINKVIDKMQYNRLISKLNDKEKEIVSLKIISGLSFEEISKLLSEPVGTIKWRYYKSINTLKLMLSNLAMFMITFVIGLKTLKRTITEDIKNKQEAIIENNTENNREIFTDEDTKKENSDVIQNSINKEKEESTEALKEEIIKRDIQTIEEVMVTSLVLDESLRQVIGAVGLDLANSQIIYFKAKAVILASGGAGNLYPITSNTIKKNGDGFMLAWNAGANLIDMEQIQFHPTGMVTPDSKKGVLVTEAVRAEGGKLLNKDGQRFMKKYAPEKMELATRDVVARSIYQEIIEGRGSEHGGVYLDITHLPDELIDEKLETMVLQFKNVGIDIKNEKIEVAPTAHHFMGGVKINSDCSTNVHNLFAAGEVSGGVHGANRLGGNALADTQVFGKRAGESAAKVASKTDFKENPEMVHEEKTRIESLIKDGSINPIEFKNNLKKLMWEKVGIVRDEKNLNEALRQLQEMEKELNDLKVENKAQYNTELVTALEVINMVEIAILVVKSAILRRESRGSHFRSDFPEINDAWKRSIVLNKNKIKFEAI